MGPTTAVLSGLLATVLSAPAGAMTADPAGDAAAADTGQNGPVRPVHTYSIVARDTKTGDIGVAVQSHWFSVGSLVIWAEAGVGAVATQSFVDPGYGPRGLALMRSGISAPQALEALVAADPARNVRQVAFVDADGKVGAHTGKQCIAFAGHYRGEGYSVQANMMLGPNVVGAMRRAYEGTAGDLAERLLAALEAAEGVGGDVRGRQSAAILIVKAKSSGRKWTDTVVDLRVEDHDAPVAELRRLVTLHRGYEHMNRGDLAIEHGDMAGALHHYEAATKLAPDNLEMKFWYAVALATNGREQQSMPIFRDVFHRDPNWLSLVKRLHQPGIIPANASGRALVKRIAAQGATRK